MAKPRPSAMIIIDVDESIDNKEFRLEIDRCYAYLAPTYVRSHPCAEGAEPTNIMRFFVKLGTRSYMSSEVEGADELWNDSVERWIRNQLYKLDNQMKIYNRRRKDLGEERLMFDTLDIDLENGAVTVSMKLDTASGIDPDSIAQIDALRTAMNTGVLGGTVVRAVMPSPASYEEQRIAGEAALEEARRAAEEEAAAQAALAEAEARAAEEAAERSFMESPEMVAAANAEGPVDEANAAEEGEADAADGANGAEDAEDEPMLTIEEIYALDQADFAIDYSIWELHYEDGHSAVYSSATGEFLPQEESESAEVAEA